MPKPKPNQPCRCGSGKKYKKCCKVADDVRSLSSKSAVAAPLRFKVGDRILANTEHSYLPGVIVDTLYRCTDTFAIATAVPSFLPNNFHIEIESWGGPRAW